MIAACVLIGLLASGLFLALAASSPATTRSRARVAARRRRFVERNPTHVNNADIVALLRRDGVSAEQARFITDKAAQHRIQPFTMWLWLKQFDAEALLIVVAADLTHTQLLSHIGNGTVPDLEELRLFASINGLPTAGPRITAQRPSVKAKQRPPMPPIFQPGTWPRLDGVAVGADAPAQVERPGRRAA